MLRSHTQLPPQWGGMGIILKISCRSIFIFLLKNRWRYREFRRRQSGTRQSNVDEVFMKLGDSR